MALEIFGFISNRDEERASDSGASTDVLFNILETFILRKKWTSQALSDRLVSY